jgi:hypothetical protein
MDPRRVRIVATVATNEPLTGDLDQTFAYQGKLSLAFNLSRNP